MKDGDFLLRNGSPIVVGWGVVNEDGDYGYVCPYGKPGERLWVKETFCEVGGAVHYRAEWLLDQKQKWTPSIYMRRDASRIDLLIKNIRVERLQAISEQDAQAEGYAGDGDESARIWYAMLWDKINGAGAWDKNPWVWVVEFPRVRP